MPGFEKRAKSLQKKVRKLISTYGMTFKRVRASYIDADSNVIPEKVDFYKARSGKLGSSDSPPMVDMGGISSMLQDIHMLVFDDLADVAENDRLIGNGYEWIVSRWDPEKFGEYIIAQVVTVNRSKAV